MEIWLIIGLGIVLLLFGFVIGVAVVCWIVEQQIGKR